MIVEAQLSIRATPEAAWRVITDVARFAQVLGGVEEIEIVEAPASGLVGLTWRETRMYFGKPASVEKRITAATEGESYEARAESDGFVFLSTNRVSRDGEGVVLATAHETRPQGLASRIKALPMIFFKGTIRKALMQDLVDFKSAAETGPR